MKWIDLPPVWTAAAAGAMWLAARAAPWPAAPSPWLAGMVALVAVTLAIWAALQFLRAGTTIIPRDDPAAMIASGPFRFTRNPIYLADALILVAVGLWLGAAAAFVWIPAFVLLIERRFISGEEARLEEAFGDPYRDYCGRVRRWV